MILFEFPDQGVLINYLDSNKQLAYALQTERESRGRSLLIIFKSAKIHMLNQNRWSVESTNNAFDWLSTGIWLRGRQSRCREHFLEFFWLEC